MSSFALTHPEEDLADSLNSLRRGWLSSIDRLVVDYQKEYDCFPEGFAAKPKSLIIFRALSPEEELIGNVYSVLQKEFLDAAVLLRDYYLDAAKDIVQNGPAIKAITGKSPDKEPIRLFLHREGYIMPYQYNGPNVDLSPEDTKLELAGNNLRHVYIRDSTVVEFFPRGMPPIRVDTRRNRVYSTTDEMNPSYQTHKYVEFIKLVKQQLRALHRKHKGNDAVEYARKMVDGSEMMIYAHCKPIYGISNLIAGLDKEKMRRAA